MLRPLAILLGVLLLAAALGGMLLWTGTGDPGDSARDEAHDTPRARERARRPHAGAADGSAGETAASPEETAERDEPVLVMRVRDPDGTPLRGVQVAIFSILGEQLADAVSDAAGNVRLTVPDGDLLARVTGPGSLTSSWARVRRGRWIPPLVTATAAQLTGTVLDATTERPVRDVEVSFRETPSRHVSPSEPPFATASTDAQGAFGPVAVPRGRVIVVTCRALGYVTTDAHVEVAADAGAVTTSIALDPAGAIVGRVLTPDRSPLAGARVVVLPGDRAYMEDEALLFGAGSDREEAIGFHVATTDDAGAFRIARIPVGAGHFALATADGWAVSLRVGPITTSHERPEASVEILLRENAVLDIAVQDPDGRPVSGALVRRERRMRFGITEELPETEERGTYRLDPAALGFTAVTVVAEGFPPARVDLQLAAGERRAEVVQLVESVSLSGVVLDDRGVPVAGATVSAHGPVTWRARHEALTATDGTFELRGLAPGKHTIFARATGHEQMRDVPPVEAQAPGAGVTLRLVRTATVRFRLRLPDGAAPPAEVPYGGAAGSGTLRWTTKEIAMDGVSPGSRTLRLHPPGFASVARPFEAAPGADVDLGEILLDPGVTLRGRVVGRDGAPIEGAQARLDRSGWMGDPTATTDAAGSFELPHASRGENRVRVWRDGYLGRDATLLGGDGATPHLFELSRGGLLRIAVETADGQPAAGAFVRVLRAGAGDAVAPDEQVAYRSADAHGRAEIRLPAGAYLIVAPDASRRPVTLVEGGTLDLTLLQQ